MEFPNFEVEQKTLPLVRGTATCTEFRAWQLKKKVAVEAHS